MMYNENLHEERHLIQQIAEQTERGKIDWELTEYNPLSFLNEDRDSGADRRRVSTFLQAPSVSCKTVSAMICRCPAVFR